ncbi:MAG: hypothetical protein IPM64_15005 [Phycisphaerales bacterium]|nr:hypothetical protein [Phycisphaerales bacterium]
MLIPRSIRGWLSVFRGGVAPGLIVLGTLLGFWFGLMPGFSGLHATLLFAMLLLNVPIGVLLLFAALGKSVSLAAAPLLVSLGEWVQNSLPALPATLGALPVIGLTDFSRYALCGALVAGPAAGLLLGGALALLVQRFRRTWLSLEGRSERLATWRRIWWVRILDWLLISKSAADVRTVLERRARYVRIPGLAIGLILAIAAGAGLIVLRDRLIDGMAEQALSRANGAEVNIGKLELSLTGARLALSDVQITDPARPQFNRAAIGSIVADISVLGLLRGQVQIEEIVLTDVRTDAPRERPGTVLAPPPAAAAAQPFAPQDYAIGPQSEFGEIESYLKSAEQLREWTRTIREWLPAPREAAAAAPPRPQADGYLAHLDLRAPRSPAPRVRVQRLKVENVEIGLERWGVSHVVAENLSDAPWAVGDTVSVTVSSVQFRSRVMLIIDYGNPQPEARIGLTMDDVALGALQRGLNAGNRVIFEDGVVKATISGRRLARRARSAADGRVTVHALPRRAGGVVRHGCEDGG